MRVVGKAESRRQGPGGPYPAAPTGLIQRPQSPAQREACGPDALVTLKAEVLRATQWRLGVFPIRFVVAPCTKTTHNL
jgi:hypothetical protein